MTSVDAPTDWVPAMREALSLATSEDAPFGENPRVGCVIVAEGGQVVGRGFHRGAGTAHAEIAALADAGERARGATAVVTLEPCRHTGRTGPCTQALLSAGVARVVYAQADPTDEAGGGAAELAAAGVEVVPAVLVAEATAVNAEWSFAVRARRPFVTYKCAASLDGRVAGPDGGPTAITGAQALTQVHALRARVGAIIVGTGTALADDPALTVRHAGSRATPLRVVVGSRRLPANARVLDDSAPTLLTGEREPAAVLADLYGRGVRHALLEGGPTLAAAFLSGELVDRVEWYLAPVLLGDGPVALPPLPEVVGVDVEGIERVGEDVHVIGRPRYRRDHGAAEV